MNQRDMVANPICCQLNREEGMSPVLVCACYFGLARPVWRPPPASACSLSTLRLNLGLTHHGVPLAIDDGVHIDRQPPSGSVPRFSGHAIAYQRRSLSRVLKANIPVSDPAFSGYTMFQLHASLASHTYCWYVVELCKIGSIGGGQRHRYTIA